MKGSRPCFWRHQDKKRLDDALVKAWKNRRTLPFEIETEDEGRDLKWRLLAVLHFSQSDSILHELGFSRPADVMERVTPSGLDYLKHFSYEYKAFGLGSLYLRLVELLGSPKETQELLLPFQIGLFDHITYPANITEGYWIQCLRCTTFSSDYTIIVDGTHNRPSHFSCSGCGNRESICWFGEMSEEWCRQFRDDEQKKLNAHMERVSIAQKFYGILPAAAGATTDELAKEELRLAGVGKFTLEHVHMLMGGFKPHELENLRKNTEWTRS